jgi:hypothetical protein
MVSKEKVRANGDFDDLPPDHQECDNRGCRYGGCQGRPSGELIAHKDARFRTKIAVRSQNGGTASCSGR